MKMSKQPNNPQSGRQPQAGQASGATRQQQQFEADSGDRFAAQIQPRMEVIGCDGGKVGRIERVEGERRRLSGDDWQGNQRGTAHYLPLRQVSSIEGDKVRLTMDAGTATRSATTG